MNFSRSKVVYLITISLLVRVSYSIEEINYTKIYNLSTLISNNETISIELPIHVILFGTIFYSILFILGTCGNIMVLIVLFKNSELRNCTNYFLANLSIADLLILFICVPIAMHDLYANERWYLGRYVCKLTGFIENCVGVASIVLMLFISCERFLAICEPFQVHSIITKSRTLKCIVLVWVFSVFINSPFLYFTQYIPDNKFNDGTNDSICITSIDTKAQWAYLVVDTFIIYLIIGIILIVIYVNICRSLTKSTLVFNDLPMTKKLNDKKKRDMLDMMSQKPSVQTLNSLFIEPNPTEISVEQQKNENFDLDSLSKNNKNNKVKPSFSKYSLDSSLSSMKSINTVSESDRNNSRLNVNNSINYLKPRRQLIFMLMCLIFVFYICVLPSKISLLFMYDIGQSLDLISYYYLNIVIRVLLFLNSAINPILYNWLSTKFRRCFKKALGFHEKPNKKFEAANAANVYKNHQRNTTITTSISASFIKNNTNSIGFNFSRKSRNVNFKGTKQRSFKLDISEIAESEKINTEL